MPLILILIFLSFVQSTLLSQQLILMAIIARSFTVTDRTNYWLAFGLGLLLSLFLGLKLGILSIVYLIAVVIVYFLKERSIGSHWAILFPTAALMLFLDGGIKKLAGGSGINISSILVQIILVLPIYILIKLWEERFVVGKEIRLKVGR